MTQREGDNSLFLAAQQADISRRKKLQEEEVEKTKEEAEILAFRKKCRNALLPLFIEIEDGILATGYQHTKKSEGCIPELYAMTLEWGSDNQSGDYKYNIAMAVVRRNESPRVNSNEYVSEDARYRLR